MTPDHALGHDEANRAAFRAEPADTSDVVGLALRGQKKDVSRLSPEDLPGAGRGTPAVRSAPSSKELPVRCENRYGLFSRAAG